jgi:peptidyl-prolyl cis-trans isomerase A (cyclophilin A)
MTFKLALLPLIALFAVPALAQPAPAPATTPANPAPAAPAPQPAATVQVTITTSQGPIVLLLEKDKAPITTANFLHYADTKRFDGTTFYRTVKVGDGFGLVQGGINQDPKKAFAPIRHEPTTQTGLTHGDGEISMAMNAPGSAKGDFFIMVGASPGMDANDKSPGYAAFGHVVQGMDIVRHMLEAPVDPQKGAAYGMKGQMMAAPIKIVTVRRTSTPLPAPAATPAPPPQP